MNAFLLGEGLWLILQLVVPACLVMLGLRLLGFRPGSTGGASPPPEMERGVDVAVMAAFAGIRGGSPWIALARNSFSPSLRIAPGGVAYRVIVPRAARFETIDSVDVVTGPGTVNLVFAFRGSPFTALFNVADIAVARSALALLPPTLPRGRGARRIEQGDVGPAAAASGDAPGNAHPRQGDAATTVARS